MTRALPEDVSAWLLDPFSGFPLEADEARKVAVRDAHAGLRQGHNPEIAASRARALLEEDPGYPPARLLLAQALFVQNQPGRAAEVLGPVVEALPDYVPAALLRARALEQTGDVAAAYAAYRDLSEIKPLAAQRAAQLREPALDVLHARFDDAMARGRIEDAEEQLARILEWAPAVARSLESQRRLQVATEDAAGELETLRLLVELDPTPERRLRRGILEVEEGDLRVGLDVLGSLEPDLLVEPAAREMLAASIQRGQFLRRLDLLPEQVRAVAELPELTRADLASLIYWLFPGVRFTPVENPPIAADILDHPQRQEILKVAGQEVMVVDEAVHRFYPARRATRSETFAALLELLLDGEPRPACLADVRQVRRSQPWICERSRFCGLIAEESDCLPEAGLSGEEALYFFQRSLAQLGGPGGREGDPDEDPAVARSDS